MTSPTSARSNVFPSAAFADGTCSLEGWLALPFVGTMDEGGDGIELRHCTCRSTIAMLSSAVAAAAPPKGRVARAARRRQYVVVNESILELDGQENVRT